MQIAVTDGGDSHHCPIEGGRIKHKGPLADALAVFDPRLIVVDRKHVPFAAFRFHGVPLVPAEAEEAQPRLMPMVVE